MLDRINKLNNKLNDIKIFDLPFLTAILLFVHLLHRFINLYSYVPFDTELLIDILIVIEQILSIFLIGLDLLSDKLTDKNKISFIVLFSFTYFNKIMTGKTLFLYIISISYIVRKLDLKHVFNFIANCLIVFFALGLVRYAYLLISNPNLISYTYSKTDPSKIRYSFGLDHPNEFSMYMSNIILLKCFSNKTSYKKYILYFIVLFITFLTSVSRNGLIVGLLSFIIVFIDNFHNEKINNAINKISTYIFPIMFILLIIMTIMFHFNIIFGVADGLTNTFEARLYVNDYVYYFLKPTLFGTSASLSPTLAGRTIDSLYILFSYKYGFVWIPIFSYIFYIISIKQDTKYSICIFIIAYSVLAIFENSGTNLIMFSGLLIISRFFNQQQRYSFNNQIKTNGEQ